MRSLPISLENEESEASARYIMDVGPEEPAKYSQVSLEQKQFIDTRFANIVIYVYSLSLLSAQRVGRHFTEPYTCN